MRLEDAQGGQQMPNVLKPLMIALAGLAGVAASPARANEPGDQPLAAATELIVALDTLVEAVIAEAPARLRISSKGPDRLVLNAGFVAEHGIKSSAFGGRANLSVAGRREYVGHNRPLRFSVAGMSHDGRVFWFDNVPPIPGDGSIGPWALPQQRVTFLIGPANPAHRDHMFDLIGDISTSSITVHREPSFAMAVGFGLDDAAAYPVATAAAGAAIAKAYGGALSGPSWDVDVAFGVMRPVRLLTLERPLVIGPLSITKIAVRVRNRVDRGGEGTAIRDADVDGVDDPSEIIVASTRKGRSPAYAIAIPRVTMANCSRLSFDKRAAKITLTCPPPQLCAGRRGAVLLIQKAAHLAAAARVF